MVVLPMRDGLEDPLRGLKIAELVFTTWMGANRDEEHGTSSDPIRRVMSQRFPLGHRWRSVFGFAEQFDG